MILALLLVGQNAQLQSQLGAAIGQLIFAAPGDQDQDRDQQGRERGRQLQPGERRLIDPSAACRPRAGLPRTRSRSGER